jgi:hypothetical protein
MAYFISHVTPLWSFAAPSNPRHYGAVDLASLAPVRDRPIWRWILGADGRPERRPASENPH